MGAHRGYNTDCMKSYLLNLAIQVYKLTGNFRIRIVRKREHVTVMEIPRLLDKQCLDTIKIMISI
jgi:hypothetical protein